jgi:cell volume regulation protein A
MEEFDIKPENRAVGKKIVELDFPKNAIIAMIKRNGKYLTPGGSTVIEPNDTLIVLSDNKEGINDVYECLNI